MNERLAALFLPELREESVIEEMSPGPFRKQIVHDEVHTSFGFFLVNIDLSGRIPFRNFEK